MKLHIGNLSKSVTEAELKDLILPFGAPSSVEIVKDHDGTSRASPSPNSPTTAKRARSSAAWMAKTSAARR